MKLKQVFFCFIAFFACLTLGSQKAAAQYQIDRLIQDFHFRFSPDALQDRASNTGYVQGLYEKTPDFPLWLLVDMGGDLLVDKDHFNLEQESVQDQDGVWIVNVSCTDEVNGTFGLHFAIDSKTGEAALKLSDAEEDLAFYSGKILPYEGVAPEFKNAKKEAESLEMEKMIDALVPAQNFSVRLASELYGSRAFVRIEPTKISTNAPMTLESEDFEVICCERQGDTWYVRFGLNGALSEIAGEEMLMDLAINVYTGDVNYRTGLADRLKVNWRGITDGKIERP